MSSTAQQIQLTRIRLSASGWAHEHITHVGNSQGVWTKEQVIQWIDSNQYDFFTSVNARRADVGVVRGDGNKAPYLRTHADGYYNDNLLALPQTA